MPLLKRILPLLLLLAAFAAQYPYVSGPIIPRHDTFYALQIFHFFCSSFICDGQIPYWSPYIFYGSPTGFHMLLAMGPMEFLALFLGKLLGITDVLSLYRISMLANEIPFILGFYLLGRFLFKNPATTLFISIAAIFTAFEQQQIFFTFKASSFLPLIFYCFFKFFDSQKPHWFWLGGIAIICGLYGNVPYIAPLWFWMLVAMLMPLWAKKPRIILELAKWQKANIAASLVFFLLAATYLLFASAINQNAVSLAPGRNPGTFDSPLCVFLTYGVEFGLFDVLEMLLGAWPRMIHSELSLYSGIPVILCCIAAWTTVRNKYLSSLTVGIIFLVAMSLAGISCLLIYYLPGMSIYRHVGYVWTIIHILLIIASGWGFEHYSRKITVKQAAVGTLLLFIAIEAVASPILGKLIVREGWNIFIRNNFEFATLNTYACLAGLLIGLIILLASGRDPEKQKKAAQHYAFLFIAVLIFDVVIFRLFLFKNSDAQYFPEELKEHLACMKARPLIYNERRIYPTSLSQEQIDAEYIYNVLHKIPHMNFYSTNDEFSRIDRWRHEKRSNVAIKSTAELTDALGLVLGMKNPPATPRGLSLLGASLPKLRFVLNARFAENENIALREVLSMREADIENTVVLVGKPDGGFPMPARSPLDGFEAASTKFTANEASFSVKIPGSGGGWLLYADSYTPAWKAYVDGKETKVWRANFAFKAIKIDSGSHNVAFVYDDARHIILSWVVAITCSLCGCALTIYFLLLLLRGLLQKTRENPAEESVD